HRDKAAAPRYFEKSIDQNGEPETVTIDKSDANLAALDALNAERETPIKIRQNKSLNNVVEHDHRAIKRRTRPCWASRIFVSPSAKWRTVASHALMPSNSTHWRHKQSSLYCSLFAILPLTRQNLNGLPTRSAPRCPCPGCSYHTPKIAAGMDEAPGLIMPATNAIESINMSLRKVIKTRSSFPTDDAVTKLFYLSLNNISKNWTMPIRDWKAALNRFTIQFEDRLMPR
ncbi:DDE-type integrase/transposase/recombinase, partial [Caballeronia terrestris]